MDIDLSAIDTPTLQLWHMDALTTFGRMPAGGVESSLSYSTPGSSRSVSMSIGSWDNLKIWIKHLQDELVRRGVLNAPPRRRRAIGLRF